MVFGLTERPAGLRTASIRTQRTTLLTTGTVSLLVVLLVPLAVLVSGGDVATTDLLSDPAELTGAPWYYGALSSLTLMAWAAGASIHLVAAFSLRHHATRLATALLWLGAFTLVWAMDDAFLLHEIVVPAKLGVPQTGTYAVYAVTLAILCARHATVLLHQSEASVLTIAVLALAGSVALDVLGWETSVRRLAEEGLKLLGASAWGAFPAKIVIRSMASSGSHEDGVSGGSDDDPW